MSALRIPMYQVDAFTSRVFAGNPAAICPLEAWLPDEQMQSIAAENNLANTAFFVPTQDSYHLRWFTPKVEVELCGHATLASAFVILTSLKPSASSVRFETKSGLLTVSRQGDLFSLDFPAALRPYATSIRTWFRLWAANLRPSWPPATTWRSIDRKTTSARSNRTWTCSRA